MRLVNFRRESLCIVAEWMQPLAGCGARQKIMHPVCDRCLGTCVKRSEGRPGERDLAYGILIICYLGTVQSGVKVQSEDEIHKEFVGSASAPEVDMKLRTSIHTASHPDFCLHLSMHISSTWNTTLEHVSITISLPAKHLVPVSDERLRGDRVLAR